MQIVRIYVSLGFLSPQKCSSGAGDCEIEQRAIKLDFFVIYVDLLEGVKLIIIR